MDLERLYPSDLIDIPWVDVVAQYSQPHRHYHTLQHIESCLGQIPIGLPKDERQALEAMVWLHDWVYEPLYADNEWHSAQVAYRHCKRGDVERIADGIMATVSHEYSNGDPLVCLFLDIDLSILSAPEKQYSIYAKQIRKEYAAVPDDLYAIGRRKVLWELLGRPIYKTRWFAGRELAARQNMKRELRNLTVA